MTTTVIDVLRKLIAAVVVVSGLGVVSPPPAESRSTSTCVTHVFDAAMVDSISFVARGRPFTAAVHDTATDCWYHLNRDMVLTTASAVKSTVLAANLASVQSQGRGFSAVEADWARRMIRYSHNASATTPLFGRVGLAGMAAYSNAVGAASMRHTTDYGATLATARDLALVSESLLLRGSPLGPLDDRSREVAWRYMANVHPSQQFGITAGVPEGYEVALKNGFFPCRVSCAEPAGLQGVYRWRVASAGFVRRVGQADGLAVAIMTDGNETQADGVALVEFIAAHVSEQLLSMDSARRLVDRARCVTVQSSDSAAAITTALGVAVGRWGSVRWTSGNEGPYRGQLMCADSLRAPEPPTAVLPGVEVVGDFNGDGFTERAVGFPGTPTLLAADVGAVRLVDRAAVGYRRREGGVAIRVAHETFSQDHPEAGDRFGAALAVGDFNGDGFGDLAVGAPGETVRGAADAGAVTILHGGPLGLQRVAFLQRAAVVAAPSAAGDHFGWALASGDVDGDGYDDLLIGVPGAQESRGSIVRMLGSTSGLTVAEATTVDGASSGVAAATGEGQRFGASLAIGNLDGRGLPEIIIGAPFADLGDADRTGLVVACRDGSVVLCNRWIHQGRRWVPGSNETGDRFGLTLAIQDTDADGADELLIGVPYEQRAGGAVAGRVVIVDDLYSDPNAMNSTAS